MRKLLPLYLGKTAGIVAAGIFLPLYSQMLTPAQFGMVALVLSAQALLLLLDLGAATQAANAFANASESAAPRQLIEGAEAAILLLYGSLGLLCLGLALLLPQQEFGAADIGLAALFLISTTLQNLYQTALQAKGRLWLMAGLSLPGQLLRSFGTWLALSLIAPTLTVFLCSQALLALLHGAASRSLLFRLALRGEKAARSSASFLRQALGYLRQSRALVAGGLIGAAAMQSDKALISAFISAAELAPYYLAVTFASAPLAVLGAPLAQLYQSRLAQAWQQGDMPAFRSRFRQGNLAMVALVAMPTALAACFAEPLCRLWLKNAAMAPQVASCAQILLAGYTIAAIGYIPFASVMASADFGFQARLSAFATTLHVLIMAIAAWQQRVDLVCMAYILYFSISTCGLWLRSRVLTSRMTEAL